MRMKDPAFDKDCLHEGSDSEADVDEDVGSAWMGLWDVLIVGGGQRFC